MGGANRGTLTANGTDWAIAQSAPASAGNPGRNRPRPACSGARIRALPHFDVTAGPGASPYSAASFVARPGTLWRRAAHARHPSPVEVASR